MPFLCSRVTILDCIKSRVIKEKCKCAGVQWRRARAHTCVCVCLMVFTIPIVREQRENKSKPTPQCVKCAWISHGKNTMIHGSCPWNVRSVLHVCIADWVKYDWNDFPIARAQHCLHPLTLKRELAQFVYDEAMLGVRSSEPKAWSDNEGNSRKWWRW